jgi:phage/plasmid-associated DNA primase
LSIKAVFKINTGTKLYKAGEIIEGLDTDEEDRLVGIGAAKKVSNHVDNTVDKPEDNLKSKLPVYNTDMKLDELKEAAKAYGIDASKLRSKADIIAAIDESIGIVGTDDDQDGDDDAPPSLNAVDAVQ